MMGPIGTRPLALAGMLTCMAAAPAAHADVAVTSTPRDTPISAYKGTVAWSQWDPVKFQYRLVITTIKTGKTTSPRIALRSAPFDVTLGPDSKGKTVALYSRCRKSDGTGCDAYRYDLAKKSQSRLDFSRDDRDEVWPSQWEGRFAWVEQRGKGSDYADFTDGNCDAPLTRTVDGEAVKELATGTCGLVTGQALRGGTIVQTVLYADDVGTNVSEVRQLLTKGGAVKRLARSKGAQGSDRYSSPLLDDTYAYVVRIGSGITPRFVRIRRSDAKALEVQAQTPLAGQLARDGSTSLYLEQQVGDPGAPGVACATFRPCRLVRADPSVFGSAERRLAPRLTFLPPQGVIPSSQPLSLSGTLTQPVVRQGTFLRSEPVAGATLEGLQATTINNANGEDLRPTGRTVTTAADGTWALTLLPPLPLDGYYAAITRSLPVAAQSPIVELKTVAP